MPGRWLTKSFTANNLYMCSFVCVGIVPICPKILFLKLCMTLLIHIMRNQLLLYENNKGADQSAHVRSLISVIVPRCLDNTIAAPAICTVNSEIFARFLFRETSHMRSFVKIKPSRNGEITPLFTDKGKSCLSCEF